MIVLIVDEYLIFICEYVVGIEFYELGFLKGLIDLGEIVFEVVNWEFKEEVGFGVYNLIFLKKFSMVFFYFFSKMNIVVVEDFYLELLEGDEFELLL